MRVTDERTVHLSQAALAKNRDKDQTSLEAYKGTILREQGVRLEELARLLAACD